MRFVRKSREFRADNVFLCAKPKSRHPCGPRDFDKDARQRPTLPSGYPDSTIGAGGLNFRVRKGNGCLPSAIVTERAKLYRLLRSRLRPQPVEHPVEADGVDGLLEQVEHVAVAA